MMCWQDRLKLGGTCIWKVQGRREALQMLEQTTKFDGERYEVLLWKSSPLEGLLGKEGTPSCRTTIRRHYAK